MLVVRVEVGVGKAPALPLVVGLRSAVGRWRAGGEVLRDSVVAAAFAAAAFTPGLAEIGVGLGELPQRRLDVLGAALVLAQCVPLAVRRRWPAVCLALVAGAFAAYQLLGYPASSAGLALLLALYGAGAYQGRGRRTVAVAATASYVLLAFGLHARGSGERAFDYVTFYVVLAACWSAGAWIRARQAEEAARRQRSVASAVAQERARIARELHDVVTHHVTAMVVQADATQFLIDSDADRATAGLTAISGAGRRALTDLRHLLEVLDTEDDPLADRDPVLGRLADLVEQTRSLGQPVEFLEQGETRSSGGGVELVAYRVVQEGLTNAVKHARGCPTVVRVQYGADMIDVEVTTVNPAPPVAAPAVTGRGLAGLRERVGVFGGELHAGGGPGGRFVVKARIPIRADP